MKSRFGFFHLKSNSFELMSAPQMQTGQYCVVISEQKKLEGQYADQAI